MYEPPESLGRMLELDLERIGMKQRDLVGKLTDEGEPPLTEQALSNWKRSNIVPRKRLDKLLEILGPESLIAKAHANGQFDSRLGERVRFRQETPPMQVTNLLLNRQRTTVGRHTSVRYNEVEEMVKAEMPQELLANFANEYRIGDMAMRFDYISQSAVIEINRGSVMGVLPNLYRSLFRLAVAKKVGDDRRVYGLIVVLPDEVDLQHTRQPFAGYNRRLGLEAQIMGLYLEFAQTPAGAAEIIKTWEKGPTSDYEEDF